MRKYTIMLLAAATFSWIPSSVQAAGCDGSPTFTVQREAIEAANPGYQHIELTAEQRAVFLKAMAEYAGHNLNFAHVWVGVNVNPSEVAIAFVEENDCVNGAALMPLDIFEQMLGYDSGPEKRSL